MPPKKWVIYYDLPPNQTCYLTRHFATRKRANAWRFVSRAAAEATIRFLKLDSSWKVKRI